MTGSYNPGCFFITDGRKKGVNEGVAEEWKH